MSVSDGRGSKAASEPAADAYRLDRGLPLYADTDLAAAEAFGVAYRTFGAFRPPCRSCFPADEGGAIRCRRLGEHRPAPTRDTPPIPGRYEAVRAELAEKSETFGF